MRFNTYYVRVRKGRWFWLMHCLRKDCCEYSEWPTHAAAMAAADAHVHAHEAIGAATS